MDNGIDESAVLAASGDVRLESVRQLVMRGMKLRGFDSVCVVRLRGLTVLSLSNNSLRDLTTFTHLVSLVELNVNFNAITSLQGLACPDLEKLYLSNNLLTSASELSAFPKLSALCLFKNILPDLETTLQPLRGLANLRRLDLDGNPCARSRGYKHRVLRTCPRLHELDGDEISQLDRDLSTLFFEEQRDSNVRRAVTSRDYRRRHRGASASGSAQRPATAPAAGSLQRNGDIDCRRGDNPEDTASGSFAIAFKEEVEKEEWEEEKETGGGDDKGLGASGDLDKLVPLGGQARLLASDRLNNDPHLLSYLAEEVLQDPCNSPRDIVEALRCGAASVVSTIRSNGDNNTCTGKGNTRSESANSPLSPATITLPAMVLAPTPNDGDNTTCYGVGREGERPEGEGDGEYAAVGLNECPSPIAEREEPPPPPPPPIPLSTSSAGLDPSDPYATIRKLLKLVETLQLERGALRERGFRAAPNIQRIDRHHKDDDNKNDGDGTATAPYDVHDMGDSTENVTEDLRRLRLEIRNMHLLMAENRELKNEARGGARAKADEETIRGLNEEVKRLREKLGKTEEELRGTRARLHDAMFASKCLRSTVVSRSGDLPSSSSTASAGDTGNSISSLPSCRPGSSASASVTITTPTTAAHVLLECEEVDEELADLFRRNEQTMSQIRRDLQLARREEEGGAGEKEEMRENHAKKAAVTAPPAATSTATAPATTSEHENFSTRENPSTREGMEFVSRELEQEEEEEEIGGAEILSATVQRAQGRNRDSGMECGITSAKERLATSSIASVGRRGQRGRESGECNLTSSATLEASALSCSDKTVERTQSEDHSRTLAAASTSCTFDARSCKALASEPPSVAELLSPYTFATTVATTTTNENDHTNNSNNNVEMNVINADDGEDIVGQERCSTQSGATGEGEGTSTVNNSSGPFPRRSNTGVSLSKTVGQPCRNNTGRNGNDNAEAASATVCFPARRARWLTKEVLPRARSRQREAPACLEEEKQDTTCADGGIDSDGVCHGKGGGRITFLAENARALLMLDEKH